MLAIQPSIPPAHALPPGDELPAGVVAVLLAASTRRTLVQGEELFEVGSPAQAMYGVLSGEIRAGVTGESGTQFFAALFGPGRWFGEVPLVDSQARVYHAHATKHTEIAVLSAPDFWRIIQQQPDVLLAITRMICSRYRTALAWIEDANLKSLSGRLAGRMAALHVQAGMHAGRSVPLSQDDLANQLGVSRQSVNRQLKIWERAGFLRLAYRSVEIVDLNALLLASKD